MERRKSDHSTTPSRWKRPIATPMWTSSDRAILAFSDMVGLWSTVTSAGRIHRAASSFASAFCHRQGRPRQAGHHLARRDRKPDARCVQLVERRLSIRSRREKARRSCSDTTAGAPSRRKRHARCLCGGILGRSGGAGVCRAFWVSPRTYCARRQRGQGRLPAPPADRPRAPHPNMLTEAERGKIVEVLRSERFCDLAPALVDATLLDHPRRTNHPCRMRPQSVLQILQVARAQSVMQQSPGVRELRRVLRQVGAHDA